MDNNENVDESLSENPPPPPPPPPPPLEIAQTSTTETVEELANSDQPEVIEEEIRQEEATAVDSSDDEETNVNVKAVQTERDITETPETPSDPYFMVPTEEEALDPKSLQGQRELIVKKFKENTSSNPAEIMEKVIKKTEKVFRCLPGRKQTSEIRSWNVEYCVWEEGQEPSKDQKTGIMKFLETDGAVHRIKLVLISEDPFELFLNETSYKRLTIIPANSGIQVLVQKPSAAYNVQISLSSTEVMTFMSILRYFETVFVHRITYTIDTYIGMYATFVFKEGKNEIPKVLREASAFLREGNKLPLERAFELTFNSDYLVELKNDLLRNPKTFSVTSRRQAVAIMFIYCSEYPYTLLKVKGQEKAIKLKSRPKQVTYLSEYLRTIDVPTLKVLFFLLEEFAYLTSAPTSFEPKEPCLIQLANLVAWTFFSPIPVGPNLQEAFIQCFLVLLCNRRSIMQDLNLSN